MFVMFEWLIYKCIKKTQSHWYIFLCTGQISHSNIRLQVRIQLVNNLSPRTKFYLIMNASEVTNILVSDALSLWFSLLKMLLMKL